MPKLQKINTDDRIINMVQDNVGNILDFYSSLPILQGNILTNISLKAASNSIPHKLNRLLTGWIVIRQRASAIIYDTQDTNTQPTVFLKLTSSAPVVVDLYVF